MDLIKALQSELDQEAETTRKFIKLVPYDKLGWKPHPKSMDFKNLASHIADLPGWIGYAINSNGFNFADMGGWAPPAINSIDDLVKILDDNIDKGKAALAKADINSFDEQWLLKNGEQVLANWTRYQTIRHSFSQLIHHRAQLGVYFRLNDIPLPGSYGPTADTGQ